MIKKVAFCRLCCYTCGSIYSLYTTAYPFMWYYSCMATCRFCQNSLDKRHKKIYCSNQCQKDYEHQRVITVWLADCARGNSHLKTKNISKHLKRYLLQKTGEKCSSCGWRKVHPVTGKVPLEVDHEDGNSNNNHCNNLRLLCPNCHALTPHFRNLNKGNGRKWRVTK